MIEKKLALGGIDRVIVYTVSFSDNYIAFTCDGHAHGGKRDAEGYNLVCAIVSAIAQTCAAGCEKYAKFYKETAWEGGRLGFICNKNQQTEAIMDTALIGLDEAARQYPEQVRRGEIDGA